MYWWKAWQKHTKFQDISPKQCKQMPQLEVTHLPAEAFVSMSTNNSNSWTQSLTSIGKVFFQKTAFSFTLSGDDVTVETWNSIY